MRWAGVKRGKGFLSGSATPLVKKSFWPLLRSLAQLSAPRFCCNRNAHSCGNDLSRGLGKLPAPVARWAGVGAFVGMLRVRRVWGLPGIVSKYPTSAMHSVPHLSKTFEPERESFEGSTADHLVPASLAGSHHRCCCRCLLPCQVDKELPPGLDPQVDTKFLVHPETAG
jgi:hypothetical protein